MDYVITFVVYAILIAAVLLWARSSNLDLGLRQPTFDGVWVWLLLFIVWRALEPFIAALHLENVDTEYVERTAQLSLLAYILKGVLLAPLFEELLFRGAMFSAFLRRWGLWPALAAPSLLWAVVHVQYEDGWTMLWIGGLGVLLTIIRWRSGSLYLPLTLHAAHNLATVPTNYGLLAVIP